MVSLLIQIGIVLLVLLALDLLAMRFPTLGEGLAFLCVLVVRVIVKIEWALEKASKYFSDVYNHSLIYPPGVTSEVWVGLYVFARLVYFLLGASTILAEGINTLLLLPALLGTTQAVHIPGNVEAVLGILVICCPALFGCLVLEIIGVIPYGARLLPHMGKALRWVLGIVCLLCLVGSILVIGDMYVFRGAYIDNPDSTTGMTVPILGGLGLLIACVAVFALWATIVGLLGIASVVTWVLSATCKGVAECCSLLPSIFDVVCVHVSGGTRTVYESYKPGEPYQVPNTWFARRIVHLAQSPASEDKKSSTEDAAIVTSPSLEDEEKESEVSHMPSMSSYVNLTLNDYCGERLIAPLVSELSARSEKQLIRSSGRVYKLNPLAIKPLGLGVDTSALSYAVQENKIVEAFNPVSAIPSLHLHTVDIGDTDCLQMVRNIQRRLSHATQVIITQVAYEDIARPSVQAFLKELRELHKEKVIATTVLLGTDSLLARSLGDITFHTYVAHFLVDLLVAPHNSVHNAGCVEVFITLSDYPFVTFAACSADTVSGRTPARFTLFKRVTNKAVLGDLDDLLSQASATTTHVVELADTRAFPTDRITPRYFITDVPLRVSDRRFTEFELRHNQQAKQLYPSARNITISGNGLSPVQGSSSPFRVGVNCLFELSDILIEGQGLKERSSVVRLMPLQSEPLAASNGNGHTNGVASSPSSDLPGAIEKQRKPVAIRKVSRTRKSAAK